jgi:hypothetical protein
MTTTRAAGHVRALAAPLRRPRGVEAHVSDREPPERREGGGGRPAPHGWPSRRAARSCRLPQPRRDAAQATDVTEYDAQRSGAQAHTGDALVLGDAVPLRVLVTRHRLPLEQAQRSGSPTSAMLASRVPPSPSEHGSVGVAATQPSDTSSLLLLAHRSHRDVPCGQASALLHSRAVRNRASHYSSHLAGAPQHKTSLRTMLPSHQPEAPQATVRPRAPAVHRAPPTACFQSNGG